MTTTADIDRQTQVVADARREYVDALDTTERAKERLDAEIAELDRLQGILDDYADSCYEQRKERDI